MYKSISIEHFRGLARLTIDRLARVNLIVGGNGVGKTTVLESLWLHSNPFNPNLAWTTDRIRGVAWRTVESNGIVVPWRYLFYDGDTTKPIGIQGAYGDQEWTLTLSEGAATGAVTLQGGLSEPSPPPLVTSNVSAVRSLELRYAAPGEEPVRTSLEVWPNGALQANAPQREALVPAVLLGPQSTRLMAPLAENLGALARKKRLDQVKRAARIIEPKLEDLVVVPGSLPDGPTVYADVGKREMIPAPLVGDGFVAILHYASALLEVGGGLTLIDEIGSGVHYSLLEPMWSAVYEMCEAIGGQLVTTTHSRECIEAAMRALPEGALLVHRLDRNRQGDVVATTLDARLLRAADELGLEVR